MNKPIESPFFNTPKGTKLPFFMVSKKKRNKDGSWTEMPPKAYLQVLHRVVWFREEHPEAQIHTSFIKCEENYTIARAEIRDEEGTLLATSHKREDRGDFNDHLEKAETSAIGRALFLCGYGTEQALSLAKISLEEALPEIDEGDRLADSPRPMRGSSSKASDKQIAMVYAKLKTELLLDTDDKITDFLVSTIGKERLRDIERDDIDPILKEIDAIKSNNSDNGIGRSNNSFANDLPF